MTGFTKLFSSIIHSTIWREPDHVRIIWVTMLAMCDRDGRVEASVPGLSDAARVDMAQCIEALNRLLAPDPYSRTTDCEGRRIAVIDGGWEIINYALYRERASKEHRRQQRAEKQQRYRDRKKAAAEREEGVTKTVTEGNALPRVTDVDRRGPIAEAEANAESETDAEGGSDAPARDQYEYQEDTDTDSQQIVHLIMQNFTDWDQMAVEIAVMKMRGLAIGFDFGTWQDIIARAVAVTLPEHGPRDYQITISRKINGVKMRAEEAAAKNKGHTQGRPQPKYEPTPDEPEETDEQREKGIKKMREIIDGSKYGKMRKGGTG